MQKFFRLLFVLWLLLGGAARAESFTYELYELSGSGQPSLLAKGVRVYSVSDVGIAEYTSEFGPWKAKEITVASGFSAGISIFPEEKIGGFGLWLKDRGSWWGRIAGGGFSWDWFEHESGDVYRKLQGPGKVRVTRAPAPNTKEIGVIEVLEDITLRVNNRPWFFFRETDTHHLLLRSGSVLRFAL